MTDIHIIKFTIIVLLLVLVVGFYFLPSLIAFKRHHHNATAIFLLNLFLGATFIAWLIALIWACTAVRREQVTILRVSP